MKKFIMKLMLLFVILFAVDRVAGFILGNWISRVTTSVLGKDNYICDHCNDDVLIFGSSRAEYHYNAKMLEDSLGLPAYNCGASGDGVIMSYGRLMMIQKRHHPKVIIAEITPTFDLGINDNHKYLRLLKSHYDREGISEIFDKVDSLEKYKMMSYLYRYNSNVMHNPLRLLKPETFSKNAIGVNGYIAMDKEFDSMKISEREEKEIETDSVKIYYLKRFAEKASETSQLLFVVSPIWYGRDISASDPFLVAKEIADDKGIPFLDFTNDPKYVHNNAYFKDGSHLNARGADEFTRDLIRELKNRGIMN